MENCLILEASVKLFICSNFKSGALKRSSTNTTARVELYIIYRAMERMKTKNRSQKSKRKREKEKKERRKGKREK